MDWDFSLIAFVAALVALARAWGLPTRLNALQDELEQRKSDQARLHAELQRLRSQVAELREAGPASSPPPPARPVMVPPARPAVASVPVPAPPPAAVVEPPAVIAPPVVPAVVPIEEVVTPPAPIPAEPVRPVVIAEPEPVPVPESMPVLPAVAAEPVAAIPAPAPELVPLPTPEPPVAAPRLATPPPPRPPVPPRRPMPAPKPEPTGPTFWERASTVLLENWTGILGAVVLVTGVGFLGIYTALKVAPPVRFLMICAFAGGLLGVRFALRQKAFARKLNAWLVSSAAAIFLFACVGAVSIPGLRWAVPPLDYLLLLAGVVANLYLAWRTSREEVATLHGVLSLVALAVLPPTAITLGAAAGVTAFSIAITYRQLWKYQLLLSITSFFAFHLYWHQELPAISESLRLTAMGLVLLVGVAAAVVQYRSVYARRRFEPLLFTAHLLNWTCLGINLYIHSTGSPWKTIPLALGAGLTFWAGRRAKQLGIGWLFQTDTIISLMLALAAALSLQGWHATVPVILLFMLLEALLVVLVMARQREALVYRVAMTGALLAGSILLLMASAYQPHGLPFALTHDAPVLALAGWAGLAFAQFIYGQPLLKPKSEEEADEISWSASNRYLLGCLAGLAGLLQASTGFLLLRTLFTWRDAPVALLLLALVALAGSAVGLASWVRRRGLAPGWVRWQQLGLGQLFVVLALVGLHEAHLSWSGVLLLIFAENLLVILLLAGREEDDRLHLRVYGAALAEAFLAGILLLFSTTSHWADGDLARLYRETLLLALGGWLGIAFVQLAFRFPLWQAVRPYAPLATARTLPARLVSNLAVHPRWLSGLGGLAGLLQLGAGGLLIRMVFGWPGAPVAGLLGALAVLAASAVGLAIWLRKWALAPNWLRWQQLVLGHSLVLLALVGLHELRVSWAGVLLLVFAENLLVLLLLAAREEADRLHLHIYRAALAEVFLTGTLLLLHSADYLAGSEPAALYREALVLALAGVLGIAGMQLALRLPLLQGIRPYLPKTFNQQKASLTLVSNHEEHRDWLGRLGGLAGLLQAGAGGLLMRAIFNFPGVPVAWLLGALVALGAMALGLAAWVRRLGLAPPWVRRQQLVLGQYFVVLAIVGLHRLGLSWPGVLLALYAENLLVALLLSGRDEENLRHVQTYLLVLQALLLPVLVRYTSPGALTPVLRAGLLLGAALGTLGYQLRQLARRFAEADFANLPLTAAYRLPVLGLAIGWLLLGAASFEYRAVWAGWALVGVLGLLLVLRQRATVPGLWAGLVLAGVGYMGLQWSHLAVPLLSMLPAPALRYVLPYLVPTLAVPGAGMLYSWWPAAERYVRAPWLYLLGVHMVLLLLAVVPVGHVAYLMLGLLALASLAFLSAQLWRRALPDAEAVARAGQPDRSLLHLGYLLLAGSLGAHLWLFDLAETFFGQPAEYSTAAALFVVLGAVAVARPPATTPVYTSWRVLHRWLPEATLLFGTLTLAHNLRAPWLPLVWASIALVLSGTAGRVPAHFRRIGLYGRLYYLLAALTAGANCLLNLTPAALLTPEWWALTAAVALLFGYVGLALQVGNAPYLGLSPAWALLGQPTRRQLEAWLLYPAFTALALLFIQSFDRSVLTVLLMLQVVAVFSTSLLLRRQDLRYVSLAGMLGCLVRLVFFDLSQSGTITRAIVFIFMGLLLLGMNALYARFKSRFAGPALPDDTREGAAGDQTDEPNSEAILPEL